MSFRYSPIELNWKKIANKLKELARFHFLGNVLFAVANAYAGIESDPLVYGVILARDLCHAQCNS